MAIAHVSSTTSQNPNNLTNTSLSVTGISTNSSYLNVVDISGVASGTDVNPTMSTPSGWTKVGECLDSTGSAMTWQATYWKFGNGSTSETFSWTNAGQMIAVATVYSGADTTNPIPSYSIAAKTSTNTSYSASVTTSTAGWIRSVFCNRSGHTYSGLADTSRGTVTLSASAAMTVQDSAADVAAGTITRTATGSGNTSVGANSIYVIQPAGSGVTWSLTFTDEVGLAETGTSSLTVAETITDTVGVTDTVSMSLTVGSVAPPSTTAPDFTALVEIAFDDTPTSSDPTYTDVTDYVRAGSIPSMSRGRSNEYDPQAQPGRASVEFLNTDDDFTVGNESSPFHPLRIRRPYRVRMAYDGHVYALWQGFVDEWINTRDETTGVVVMRASDRIARAAGYQLRALVVEEILADGATLYYPLGDASGSISAGEATGNGPNLRILRYGNGIEEGDIAFGTDDTPGPDSGTVVEFTPLYVEGT